MREDSIEVISDILRRNGYENFRSGDRLNITNWYPGMGFRYMQELLEKNDCNNYKINMTLMRSVHSQMISVYVEFYPDRTSSNYLDLRKDTEKFLFMGTT